MRLQNGDGEDRNLGADIREVFSLPHTFGDPTGCMDCSLWLADFLNIGRLDVIDRATNTLRARVKTGWKGAYQITHADVARAITAILLKGKIARLEETPA